MNIQNALEIDGWMSEAELKFLAEQAKRAKFIVEFGCYKGRSTRALADNTEGRVYAIDPWNGDYPNNNGSINEIRTDVFQYFKANLIDKINSGTVIPVKEFSYNFHTSDSVDFVFIDGDHRYEEVKKDIEVALKLLRPGGIIAGHDYGQPDWYGVKQAVDEIFPEIQLVESIWYKQV